MAENCREVDVAVGCDMLQGVVIVAGMGVCKKSWGYEMGYRLEHVAGPVDM